ncbi:MULTISPECIES: multiprotein bridging factor aMBF1 [Metallosphaera]|uniref:Transcriptional regulator, XRE family n=4 Tax=Metallosphaera TaxID=41980 RepID=A4YJ12_METS5|nr:MULTISPECIES: multiprotein bridging factor aMBF1 [Metallosphaera]ABP96414.1 transcriptional regulator, XRE family [Metallosphaera sedula DSM 5348]AIM28397.1 transcriptional regulator, XRE family [Metallosphaera sedula]MCH1771771.1 multiprotein bridging factor aMBF1 [Metallosphaera sedula]MCP6729939.1 multiprotein bridging factor aMBF1 [Metallosphaera sedula]MCY0862596.1 multiprotein bridging factor aMBF1 [Metallosphaera prunae]
MRPMKKGVETYCEMCGNRIDGPGFSVKFEGSTITVCRSCYEKIKKHSTLVPRETKPQPAKQKRIEKAEEVELDIDEEYPRIIKEGRERLHMSTKELAERMKVQENIIKRMEMGKLKPTINEARILERILNVKLVVQVSQGKSKSQEPDDQTLTLGDIIRIREGKK